MTMVVSEKSRRVVSNIIGKYINSPEQRLIQGVTALALQPAIDYMNHKADDDTRAVSVARTIGKIIAGTIVGVAVRYGAIYAAKNFSKYAYESVKGGFVGKVGPARKKDVFMPTLDLAARNITPKEFKSMHENFVKTMGTLVATFAMVFTNFLIDAPLTKWITKKLTPKVKSRIENKENSGVKNATD